MQGRGEEVVEFVQVPSPEQGLTVKESGILRELGHRTRFHGAQKHGRVHQSIEAATDRMATGGQVQRRAHRHHCIHGVSGHLTSFLRPTHQGVAPQRNTHRQKRAGMLAADTLQDPAHLLEISRVVGTWCSIRLSAATTKMRHRQTPTPLPGLVCPGLRVVAAR